ncbi:PLP-dependent aminotransferase family protein [Vibrio sp. SCSIO 43135]|uniref:aminotransferase-like domain-containing protein n=1 Tax=Vibrio sp. SCSIO 43135 TaxID=2819096 RepID=UPI0020752B52|nr:PLP-dependent aminotransferase family protein [Vibrio sp. SCSIO 43135]USD42234.1 PLP-dependent aminotransferase family protein [Vibrio sp. SCSIO 43135]
MSRYQQVAEQIKQQIIAQTWRAGEKIPSVRVNSRNFSVAPSTILQAYQLLESEGWVIAKPQAGYFVAPQLGREQLASKPAESKLIKINDELFEFLKSGSNKDVVPLGSAFPDPSLFPIQTLNRNLASAGRKMSANDLVSVMPPGDDSLRRCIAQRYQQQGISVSPQDIVVTSGALEALNISLQSVTKPGDTVVIESPAFYGALQAIERLNLRAIEVPVSPQSGLCLETLEHVLSTEAVAACWFMANFHNPTTYTHTDTQKTKITALAEQYQVPIIEDDVYGELYFETSKPKPLKAFDDVGNVLLCGSFSKSLCPGYRVGWVVSDKYNEHIQRLQLMSTLSGSAPIQNGIAHFLQHDSFDSHLRKLRKTLQERRDSMLALIHSCFPAGTKVSCPTGGYFLWLELAEHINARHVYECAVEQGATVAYGKLFSTSEHHQSCLRLNYSYPLDTRAKQVIEKMADLVRKSN